MPLSITCWLIVFLTLKKWHIYCNVHICCIKNWDIRKVIPPCRRQRALANSTLHITCLFVCFFRHWCKSRKTAGWNFILFVSIPKHISCIQFLYNLVHKDRKTVTLQNAFNVNLCAVYIMRNRVLWTLWVWHYLYFLQQMQNRCTLLLVDKVMKYPSSWTFFVFQYKHPAVISF